MAIGCPYPPYRYRDHALGYDVEEKIEDIDVHRVTECDGRHEVTEQ